MGGEHRLFQMGICGQNAQHCDSAGRHEHVLEIMQCVHLVSME